MVSRKQIFTGTSVNKVSGLQPFRSLFCESRPLMNGYRNLNRFRIPHPNALWSFSAVS